MSFFTVEVHDELFQGWLKETQNNFHLMIETMIQVSEMIKKKVQTEYSPIRTGKLSRSFREFIVTNNSRMKVVEIQMSALNERTGYDYAEIQHRGYTYAGKYGRTSYRYGTKHLGFFTFVHYKMDDSYDTLSDYVGGYHQGRSKYMYWAIKDSQQSAYELIETDYLSMFKGGFIV